MLLTASLVWDIRSFKRPIAARSEVPTMYPSTNAIFSPDNKHVVTGVGGSEKGGHGALLFMRRDNLEVVKQLDVGATPVVVHWHPKINQVRSSLAAVLGLNKRYSADCIGAHKRSVMCIVFASNISQRGQIITQ
jgi:hypothetical protein